MENENFVPYGSTVVRLKQGDMFRYESQSGAIFKTTKEHKNGNAYYDEYLSIVKGNWRYATALETYCLVKHKITNISQITYLHEIQFNKYIKEKTDGNKEENLHGIENARPNGIGQRAIAIRKPTKQIAIGERFIGNQTKGKFLEKRIASVTLKTDPIKF